MVGFVFLRYAIIVIEVSLGKKHVNFTFSIFQTETSPGEAKREIYDPIFYRGQEIRASSQSVKSG